MTNYDERKSADKAKEKIVHEWLEENLWSKFPDYVSNSERADQLRGVDCRFTGSTGYEYICDEKAVTGEKYINKPVNERLKTFCLELSMRAKRNGKFTRYTGWLLNEKEINNSFAFVWVDRTKSGTITSIDDILEAEVAVVRKDKIWEYLNSKGWNSQNLQEQVDYVLANPDAFEKGTLVNGVKFSYPKWLRNAESPVNILLSRNIYRELADFHKIYKFE